MAELGMSSDQYNLLAVFYYVSNVLFEKESHMY